MSALLAFFLATVPLAAAPNKPLAEGMAIYDEGELERAVSRLRPLVSDRRLNEHERGTARLYLAAAYFGLGDEANSRLHLAILGREQPDIVPDERIFPPDFITAFRAARIEAGVSDRPKKPAEQLTVEYARPPPNRAPPPSSPRAGQPTPTFNAAPVVAGAIGVALGGGSAALYLLARGVDSRLRDPTTQPQTLDALRATLATGRTYQVASFGLAMGSVAALGSAAFFAFSKAPSPVAVLPAPGGVVAVGAFP